MSATTPSRRSGKSRMFLRMLLRASLVRRGRALSALLAVVVAAAVATAMLNLYVDVQAKLRTEFRKYGANIVVVGKQGTAQELGCMDHGRFPFVWGQGSAEPGRKLAGEADGTE